jgi:hypothetical protein
MLAFIPFITFVLKIQSGILPLTRFWVTGDKNGFIFA